MAAEGTTDTASTSLAELLGPVGHPVDQQHQQMDWSTSSDKRASLSGSFLDELMSGTWDDGESELVFHDDQDLLEIDTFSKIFDAHHNGSPALATHHQNASPSIALSTLVVNSTSMVPVLPPSQSTVLRGGKRGIAPPPLRAIAATFMPGKPRMRRKLEIQLLRDESEKLQTKLQNLREYWKQMSAAIEHATWAKNADKPRSLRTALVRAESMWKPIAARQRDALSKSERENQELKMQFQLQRKMLQRLRKLITKRVSTAHKMEREIRDVPFPNPKFVAAGCTATFHKLLNDSVSMYMEASKVQSLFTARDDKKRIFREWVVKENASKDLQLEMVDSYVIPFDRLQVTEVLKGFHNIKRKKWIGEYFQASDDTTVRQYISSFRNVIGTGVVRVKEVIRTFVDEAQTIFVTSTSLERLSESGKLSHLIRSKKWVIVRSCSDNSGGSSSPATSIQSYYTFKPEMMLGEYSVMWCKPMIEDVLVPILDVGTTKGHQELENTLIGQGCASSKWITIVQAH